MTLKYLAAVPKFGNKNKLRCHRNSRVLKSFDSDGEVFEPILFI